MLNSPISRLIGNTPLVRLSSSRLFAKLEYFNPSGSIKDRTAFSLLRAAGRKGIISKGSTIIEPTSGNTGISLAWLCRQAGYRAVLVMPKNTSLPRVKVLKALGAKIVFTPAGGGLREAKRRAERLSRRYGYYMPDQFSHPANPRAHHKTAEEIWHALGGKVDVVVAGIGTGGTITGLGEFFKKKNPKVKIVGVEPQGAAALYARRHNRKPAFHSHKIEGLGAGFVPAVLKEEVIDEVALVSSRQAERGMKYLIEKESIWGGLSAGAAWHVSFRLSTARQNRKKNIVFIVPDSFWRYI